MASFLVTGGAGFIGSHIAEELIRQGHRVRILDNFLTGKRENIAGFRDAVDLVEGDIRELETCRASVEGINYILHQAALPSVPRSVADPALTNAINITGTLNMLLASREADIKRFVFASSSSVYGNDPRLPKKEDFALSPLSPYALSKIAGEQYCQVFQPLYGLSTVCLRYFNIFGPRQDPTSQYAAVIPNFITRMIRGQKPMIFGDGEQSRDFTFVSNVVEANILAATTELDVSGQVFNLACGTRTSVQALAGAIAEILGVDLPPVHEEPRPGDVKHSFADTSKISNMLKYEPRTPLKAGLERTIQWYKDWNSHE